MDYGTLYHRLFAACADAVEQMEAQNYGRAREILILAQQSAEEAVLDAADCADAQA